MQNALNAIARGTRKVFESPTLAVSMYGAALAAVLASMVLGLGGEQDEE